MNFKPCSEQEIADRKLWAKAVYPFEIMEAVEKVSQSGHNPMIELKVKISRADGASRVIPDYLVEQRAEKLKHAAAACGLLDKYESGSLPASDFRGKRGKLKLTVEKGKNGYPDRNVIADYVVTRLPDGNGQE
jgi:hypothetical protein